MIKRVCQPAGFTLMELLISLTIIAVIFVIAGGAFRLGVRAVEKGDRKVEESLRFVTVVGLLEDRLHAICFDKNCHFKGGVETLEFVFHGISLNGEAEGFREVRLNLKEDKDGDGQVLDIQEMEAYPLEISPPYNIPTHPLLSGLSGASFGYLAEESLGKREWTDEWNGGNDRPFAVRVRFEFQGQTAVIISHNESHGD